MLIWSVLDNEAPEEMLDLMEYGETVLKGFKDSITQNKNNWEIIYELGCLQGCAQTAAQLFSDKIQDKYVVEQIEKYIPTIKHLEEVIKLIYKYSSLSHSALAHKMNMKESTLTECMKKILLTKLVESRKSGKYKIYFLSEYGTKYAIKCEGFAKDKKEEKQIDYLKEKDTYLGSNRYLDYFYNYLPWKEYDYTVKTDLIYSIMMNDESKLKDLVDVEEPQHSYVQLDDFLDDNVISDMHMNWNLAK